MLVPTPTRDPQQAVETATAEGVCPQVESPRTSCSPEAPRRARIAAAVFGLLRRPRAWAAVLLLALAAAGVALAFPHLRAWHHWRAAHRELERYHNPQAIHHLQICLGIWPKDPDVLLAAARSARRALSYPEAQRLLEMYQRTRGLDEAVSLEQLLLSAELQVDSVAEACWHRIERNEPETPLILEAVTRGYLRHYRLVEARQCLNYWMQNQPDNPQAHSLDGYFHLEYEHVGSAAEASYRRAVELDAEHEEARLGLAVALLNLRAYDEAFPHLEMLRRCHPENVSVKVGLAECYQGLGKGEEALALIEEALAVQPDSAQALAMRGQLALQYGEPTEAETLLRRAVALNPIDDRAQHHLYLVLQQSGKEEEARQLEQQLQQTREDVIRFNEILTKEMIQRPNDPALHCTLGQILLRRRQRTEGLRWLQSALRLDPQYTPARQALADYYQGATAAQKQSDSRP
jgi:predicted Zn-dependent protease